MNKNRLIKKAHANIEPTNVSKRGLFRIYVITFLLMLISLTLLATAVAVTNAENQPSVGEVYNPRPLIKATVKADSRGEISLNMEFTYLADSHIFEQDKFVVGLFSSDFLEGITLNDANAYYENKDSGLEIPLVIKILPANLDNHQIELILCRFPEGFRDSEGLIPNVTIKATLSKSVYYSKLISGNKYYFPFDWYNFNLYVLYLEKNQSDMRLSSLEPNFESGLETLSVPEKESQDIDGYPQTRAFLTQDNKDNNFDPVIQLVKYEYRTKYSILLYLAIFFWPFYFTTGLGMWISLKHPNKESHLPMEIFLTSAVLLLALSTFYIQITPSEISYSTIMSMAASNAVWFMLSFGFVSVVSLFRQYRVGERLKRNLQVKIAINRKIRWKTRGLKIFHGFTIVFPYLVFLFFIWVLPIYFFNLLNPGLVLGTYLYYFIIIPTFALYFVIVLTLILENIINKETK